jgi:TM2 domain-containing membrane protein YozV
MTYLIISAICLVIMAIIGHNAPEGYQDKEGFHYGSKSRVQIDE